MLDLKRVQQLVIIMLMSEAYYTVRRNQEALPYLESQGEMQV